MRKVTTINLNGRAYQLEDTAYDSLQAYLQKAEKALAHNPDHAEVMGDLEQAIGDKCEAVLVEGKTVVNEAQMKTILEQMGEVRDESEEADPDSASGGSKTSDTPKAKRLFVVREGAMIAGVCQGLGAYFGIDANILRIAFIILTLITSGFWILVYLALALFLPVAKTDVELSEAYGKPVTAQDVVNRVKERAPSAEAMHRTGTVVKQVAKIIFKVAAGVAVAAFTLLTFGYVSALWMLGFGKLELHDKLAFMNGWEEALVLTLSYALVAIPLFVIYRGCMRTADSKKPSKVVRASEYILFGLWAVALFGLVVFGSAHAAAFRDYVNAHNGYLDIGSSSICVDADQCNHGMHYFYDTQVKDAPFPPPPPLPDR